MKCKCGEDAQEVIGINMKYLDDPMCEECLLYYFPEISMSFNDGDFTNRMTTVNKDLKDE